MKLFPSDHRINLISLQTLTLGSFLHCGNAERLTGPLNSINQSNLFTPSNNMFTKARIICYYYGAGALNKPL